MVFNCPVVNQVEPYFPGNIRGYCHYSQNWWLDNMANIHHGYVTYGQAPGKLGRARKTDIVYLAEAGFARCVSTYANNGYLSFFQYNKGPDLYRHHSRFVANAYGNKPWEIRYGGYYGSSGGANYILLHGAGKYLNGDTRGLFYYAPDPSTTLRMDPTADRERLWFPWHN